MAHNGKDRKTGRRMVVAYLRTSCMIGKPRYISHHAADCPQVDPDTNGGRGGLSQLSGVTLLSPPVIAYCEKLAQKHGMSSSSPGLAAELARISHRGNADVLGLDQHLSCRQRC